MGVGGVGGVGVGGVGVGGVGVGVCEPNTKFTVVGATPMARPHSITRWSAVHVGLTAVPAVPAAPAFMMMLLNASEELG